MEGTGQLALKRRAGEAIVIGGCIQVVIKAIHRSQVTLLIRAPRWVRVDREEIHARRADTTEPDRSGLGSAF